MRAFILFATLASTAFAYVPPKTAPAPVPNTLCPVQGSAVNANCPLTQNQTQSSCLPELTGTSATFTPAVERHHGRNS